MKVIGSRSRSQEQKCGKIAIPAVDNKSAIRQVLKRYSRAAYMQQGIFGYGRSNSVTAIFVM